MRVVAGAMPVTVPEDEGQSVDRISDLPETIIGDIVSRLPAKDGARTQVLSSRWRRIWRSAPLNLDLRSQPVPLGKVRRILASHPGPGRCFSTPARYYDELRSRSRFRSASILDGWLRSRALNNLKELDFRLDIPFRDRRNPPPPLPASALRFSCTLRIARFWFCRFPDGISVRLPVLEELQLSHAIISESSLHALLAGCTALQRLLLTYNDGCSCVRIASPTLRSIDVGRGVGDLSLQQLIIEDAPCLERLHHHPSMSHHKMDISVMSAPKLGILGDIYDHYPRLEIGPTVFQGLRVVTMATVLPNVKVLSLTNDSLSLNKVLNFMKCFPSLEKLNIKTLSEGSEIGPTVFQGLRVVTMATVLPSVKVLSLTNDSLSLNKVLNFMKCFPSLEKLNIKTLSEGSENVWGNNHNHINIGLKKIVLINYRANESHVNFVKFFVLNARVIESIRLVLPLRNASKRKLIQSWIEGQGRLLQFEERASKSATLEFLSFDRFCNEAIA